MKYKDLPGTDLTPSVIGVGALPFGISLDDAASFEMMDRFAAAGGNFIDTALVYGEWLPNGRGRSEKTVGAWIKQRGIRQQMIVGTKGAHPALTAMDVPRLSPDQISDDLDASLHNLQTDYIDLYWLHRDDPNRPVADILETLNKQVRAGKIRYFGCSNWHVARIQEAQDYAATHGLHGFAGNQLMWSLAEPNRESFSDPTMVAMDQATWTYHQQSGLAAMPYNSQARGFFTRLHQVGLAGLPESLRSTYDNQENRQRMERLSTLAQALSLPLSVLALAYLIAQPFPTYPLSGCSSLEQLNENLQATEIALTPAQRAFLEHGA